jgi:SAM-dependent methyltransferase
MSQQPTSGVYFSGEVLYGDSFTSDQILAWHEHERHAYFDLYGAEEYPYHALNQRHGYRHLPQKSFAHCLAFGCGSGDELLPIASRLKQITAIEPSVECWSDSIASVPCNYQKPDPLGDLNLPDNSIDLVTCFGVLHHVPNVSHVLGELFRVCAPGAYLLVREPTISMGDWSRPRPGLTPNERGLPTKLFLHMLGAAGFRIDHATHCMAPVVPAIGSRLHFPVFNSPTLVILDQFLSAATKWNWRYHQVSKLRKLSPKALFVVSRKP